MIIKRNSEKGQAIILIAFAIIGLIGLTALTVDSGMAYSDRRNAQNAADNAATAGGRAKIHNANWKQAALNLAAANGYADTDPTSASSSPKVNVEVYQCSESGVDCGITLLAGDTTQNYIEVKITSTINTYFSGVVGIRQITDQVSSVERVTGGINQPMGSGSAIFSLDPNGCASVSYQGSATVTLVGSGIYVNSTCNPNAFSNSSNSPGLTAPCIQSAGGIQYVPGSIIVPNSCILSNQAPIPAPTLPNPICTTNAVKSGSTMIPGNWTGAFPPSGVTSLQSGVYCVDAGNQNFSLSANNVLTGHGVTIYMISGGVTWNGQATVQLDAPTSGPFKGLLIYLPPSNINPLNINGGGDSTIVGTFLAPASQCNILGGGGANGIQSQFVCYDVKLGGGSNTTIVYNATLQYQPPSPPVEQLTR